MISASGESICYPALTKGNFMDGSSHILKTRNSVAPHCATVNKNSVLERFADKNIGIRPCDQFCAPSMQRCQNCLCVAEDAICPDRNEPVRGTDLTTLEVGKEEFYNNFNDNYAYIH
jgi:hypothetical protein